MGDSRVSPHKSMMKMKEGEDENEEERKKREEEKKGVKSKRGKKVRKAAVLSPEVCQSAFPSNWLPFGNVDVAPMR